MKYLLYGHGGSGNHGCEAIVRTTVQLIADENCTLYTSGLDKDIAFGIDKICSLKNEIVQTKRCSLSYIKAFLQHHIIHDFEAYDRLAYRTLFDSADSTSIAISIGGDNYCYSRPVFLYLLNKNIRAKGAKTVLWGCSVEPANIDDEMRKDLQQYDLIVARESISYNCLKKINANTLLYPDPAFTLPTQKNIFPDERMKGNTVGINVSPLILNYEKQDGITLSNYITLIEYILATTTMHIALIPHVVIEGNNDLEALKILFDKFKSSDRIHLIKDNNCMVLKGYISQCRFFVCARTHASIAAYSTNVPTIVVGYSTKAKGIAEDIFGTDENYVIPVQSLKNDTTLKNQFTWLLEHENQVRAHLTSFMPGYCKRASELRTVVHDFFKDEKI